MEKDRLTAFSDGVIAIIITIMVLEIHIPESAHWSGLHHFFYQFLGYTLSFFYVAIYWNNHHHMLHTVHRVNGKILWANMHLLFWLSLMPFATAWLGKHFLEIWPTVLYGVALLLSAIAYYILELVIMSSQGKNSPLRKAVGEDRKGQISLVLYSSAIVLAFYFPPISMGIYMLVALLWLVPDRRIERYLHSLKGLEEEGK